MNKYAQHKLCQCYATSLLGETDKGGGAWGFLARFRTETGQDIRLLTVAGARPNTYGYLTFFPPLENGSCA